MPNDPTFKSRRAPEAKIRKRQFQSTSAFCRVDSDFRQDKISLSEEPWNRPAVTEDQNKGKMAP